LPRTEPQIQAVADLALERVRSRAWFSAGAAAVPLPIVGLAADVNNVLRLLNEINALFGLTPEQIETLAPAHRTHVYEIISTMGGSWVGRTLIDQAVRLSARALFRHFRAKPVIRWIPFAGQLLAAGISYTAIRVIGAQHIADCVAVARALAQAADRRQKKGTRRAVAQRAMAKR